MEVLGAFMTDDILMKLNAVELMDALGSFQAGQELLSKRGVPERLAQDLTDPMCDEATRLCVVRLLGFVLMRTPDALAILLPGRDAPLASAIAAFIESRDPAERLCALTVWTSASSHDSGLSFFLRWTELTQAIITAVSSTQTEVAKGALNAWGEVLRPRPPPEEGTTSAQQATESFQVWELAQERLLPLVLRSLTAKPFPDVRCCVWRLLAVLIASRPIARSALTSEELRTLLLDFSSESNSEARISKHEFVVALVRQNQDWIRGVLGDLADEILREYACQGPHWVPRVAAPSVEQTGA